MPARYFAFVVLSCFHFFYLQFQKLLKSFCFCFFLISFCLFVLFHYFYFILILCVRFFPSSFQTKVRIHVLCLYLPTLTRITYLKFSIGILFRDKNGNEQISSILFTLKVKNCPPYHNCKRITITITTVCAILSEENIKN